MRNYKTISDIMALDPQDRFKQFHEVDIDRVIIDGNEIRDYKAYRFIWEKTYVKSPERSSNGSMGNLNSYATFIVGHLYLDFSLMSIEEYRLIMRLHYSKNEFVVECRDVINGKPIKLKMYFATEQVAKLFTIANCLYGGDENNVMLLGVEDYTVEMIGTNNDLDLVSIVYYPNYESVETNDAPQSSFEAEEDIYMGEDIVVGKNSTYQDNPPTGYKFSHWVDETGETYPDGSHLTINDAIVGENKALKLYAVWQKTTQFTLSFDYGLSSVATEINASTGELKEILTKDNVQFNESIGGLPTTDATPKVTIDKIDYYPYYGGGWYKKPYIDDKQKVNSGDLYWATRNTTIYRLYKKVGYTVTYQTNQSEYLIPTQELNYKDKVIIPTLAKQGKTFKGWYSTSDFTGSAITSLTMPPQNITLYAKWE